MAMSSYITLLDDSKVGSSPNTYLTIKYAHERDGANMKYKIYVYARLASSSSYRNDSHGLTIKLDGTQVYSDSKWKPSGSGHWPRTHEATYTVANKTSGSTSLSVRFWDSQGAADIDTTKTYSNLIVEAAGSAMGTTNAGYTLEGTGPVVNVTKYSTNFYDCITLSYNGKSITRNGFTSSRLTFSEAERLAIFQAQGAGQTKSWSISGKTYTDSSKTTTVGTFSGSVNISTEALHEISSLPSVNVESSMNVSTLVHCGGTYDIIAYKTSDRTPGTNNENILCSILDRSTAMSAVAMTPDKDKLYAYNKTSKSGTIYWRITSKINGTSVGYKDYTSTYNFVQSLCGPSMSTFTYKVTDAGTKVLKGATGNAINYNASPGELGLFIKGKTTLTLAVSGSVNSNKGASLSKYNISVPGQTVSGSTATSYNTQVLKSNGALSASVTDSRGFTSGTLSTNSITLNDYYNSSINSVSGERYPKSNTETDNDKRVKISFSATAPNYILSNSDFVVRYRYKASGDTNWTTVTTDLTKSSCTISGNTISVTNFTLNPSGNNQKVFDISTQYEIQVGVADYYNSTGVWSPSIVIPVSSPLLAKRLKRLGINKIPDPGYALDVSGKIRTDNSMEVGSYLNVGTDAKAVNGFYSYDVGNVDTPSGTGRLVIKRAASGETPNNGVVLEYGNSTSWTGQLFIGDNATQGLYYNGWTDGTRGSWKRLAFEDELLNKIYPVGSLYLSVNNTNPGDLFGGTWEQINGYYLYAGNTYSKTSYTGVNTQGHSLTVEQMPAHTHTGTTSTNGAHTHTYGSWKPRRAQDGSKWPTADNSGEYTTSRNGDHHHTFTTDNAGSGNSHSHNIATVQIYAWRRTG